MNSTARILTWSCAALGFVTGAWLVGSSPAVIDAIATTDAFWGLLIAQFGTVLALSTDEHSFPSSVSRALFLLYATLTGVMLPVALHTLTGRSMAAMFLMTVGAFVALARYVAGLKRKFASFGDVLFIGLLALVLTTAIVLL